MSMRLSTIASYKRASQYIKELKSIIQSEENLQTTLIGEKNRLCIFKKRMFENHRNFAYIDQKGEVLARCNLSKSSDKVKENPLSPDGYGDYLEVDILQSVAGIKGTGTKLIEESVRQSVKDGLEGRLALNATNSALFKSYRNKDGQYPSPVPFYLKRGFKPGPTPSSKEDVSYFYAMYLPLEAIKKIRERIKI